ncbi:MAG TPA: hypothetical protein VEF34_07960 [Syntrophobacteraceae bacterium]|nr:hypothetical protein [Syntrophobacteraceae bacterium]
MEWLEIISVESARSKDVRKIIELCNEVKVPPSAELTVCRMSSSNEVRVHIQWISKSFPEGGRSKLGRELSRTLSDYGLVSHTFWVAGNQSSSGEQPDYPVPQKGKP